VVLKGDVVVKFKYWGCKFLLFMVFVVVIGVGIVVFKW